MSALFPLVSAALLAAFAGSAAATPVIRVENAHVRPVPASLPMTAGYMSIRNLSERPDALLGATCACATEVSAHETGERGGMSTMRASATVIIPAKGAITFAPGGRHLMLMGVKGGVRPGQTVAIRLRFQRAGTITVPFTGRP